MLTRESLGVISVDGFEQCCNRGFGGECAYVSKIGRHRCHGLVYPPCAVGEFLVGFGVHRPALGEVPSKAEQASEAWGGAESENFADCAVGKHASENCGLAGTAGKVADDSSWGDAVGRAQYQVDGVNQRSNIVRLVDNVDPMSPDVLGGPTSCKVGLEG